MDSAGGSPAYYKQRRVARKRVDGSAQLRHSGWYKVEVTIRDVSTSGFMAECLMKATAPAAEVLLVADEQRGPETRGQVADIKAADHQRAGRAVRGARPDRRIDGVDVRGRGRRVILRQYVSVARACRVGDAAHGAP